MLKQFYAVTTTSVYFVKHRASATDPYPIAIKVKCKSQSDVRVGSPLAGGTNLAITDRLQMYIPEGGGLTSYERMIENVNTRYWGGHSSEIIALFTNRKKADECLNSDNLVPVDPRWKESTKEVLRKIGDDHPSFYICRHEGMMIVVD